MNTKSAKNAREFVAIMSRDDEDRPSVFKTPGHNGKVYGVTFTRNGCVSATCKQVGGAQHVDCPGNSTAVCYHVLAACDVAADDVGLQLSWCGLGIQGKRKARRLARRLARLDGYIFCVESAQSGKRAWGVVKGHKPFSLLAWAEKLENVSWYDAELARKVALYSPESNIASLNALSQLLNKYPEQHENLAALFPRAVLKIWRDDCAARRW